MSVWQEIFWIWYNTSKGYLLISRCVCVCVKTNGVNVTVHRFPFRPELQQHEQKCETLSSFLLLLHCIHLYCLYLSQWNSLRVTLKSVFSLLLGSLDLSLTLSLCQRIHVCVCMCEQKNGSFYFDRVFHIINLRERRMEGQTNKEKRGWASSSVCVCECVRLRAKNERTGEHNAIYNVQKKDENLWLRTRTHMASIARSSYMNIFRCIVCRKVRFV